MKTELPCVQRTVENPNVILERTQSKTVIYESSTASRQYLNVYVRMDNTYQKGRIRTAYFSSTILRGKPIFLRKNKMKIPTRFRTNYDEEADVLYISFGHPRKGIGVELREGDIVRVDPYTDDVVGMTIIDFKDKYWKKPGVTIHEKASAILLVKREERP